MLKPLKLVIENYPEGPVGEEIEVVVNPESETPSSERYHSAGSFTLKETISWEDPQKSIQALSPGAEVRLKQCLYCKMLRF